MLESNSKYSDDTLVGPNVEISITGFSCVWETLTLAILNIGDFNARNSSVLGDAQTVIFWVTSNL